MSESHRMPLHLLYAEALWRVSLSESQISMYLQGFNSLARDPIFRRHIARLKLDTDGHQRTLSMLLEARDVTVLRCAARLEHEVSMAISNHVDARNLSMLPDLGLALAAVKLQDYALAEYRRALDLAHQLKVRYDVTCLDRMCHLKRLCRDGLANWASHGFGASHYQVPGSAAAGGAGRARL